MSGFLLDTNVLSELLKKRPDTTVLEHLGRTPREALVTSCVCVFELRHGAARRPDGGALWRRIAGEVLPRVRILSLGLEEAERAGDLFAKLNSRGEPIGLEDVLIGATALTHGLVVVTRNVRHFNRLDGLAVVSWWDLAG